MFATVPVKQPWKMLMNGSHETIKKSHGDETTAKLSKQERIFYEI